MNSQPQPRTIVSSLPAYVPGRKATSRSTAALASNESHFDPLPVVLDAVLRSADALNRYPDPGALDLRRRLAEKLGIEAEQIAVGPGSIGVLQQIITAFCDAGDEVVFAWRSFEAYPLLVALAGAIAVTVPLTPDERHDLAALASAVTERTRIVLLCSPNNPTGTTIREKELREFLARVSADVVVVIDEAYLEFDDDAASADSIALLVDHPNIVVLRTFSKAYGLAGLRVGYAVAAAPVAEAIRKAVLLFGVTALAQHAALASLEADSELTDRVTAIISERERVRRALAAGGTPVPRSGGNFIWIRCSGTEQRRLVDAFDRADVLVRAFPDDGVRVGIADAEANDRVIAVLGHWEASAAER